MKKNSFIRLLPGRKILSTNLRFAEIAKHLICNSFLPSSKLASETLVFRGLE